MTTDTGLDQNAMLQIAESMRGLNSGSVQFVTAPNVADPQNNANVVFQQPQADELFTAIAHDNAVPKAAKKPAKGKKPQTSVVAATTTPSNVNVDVLNGTSVPQLAGTTGTNLTSRGFKVVGTADATRTDYTKSIIEYATAADLPAANTLEGQLSDAEVEQDTVADPGHGDVDPRLDLHRPEHAASVVDQFLSAVDRQHRRRRPGHHRRHQHMPRPGRIRGRLVGNAAPPPREPAGAWREPGGCVAGAAPGRRVAGPGWRQPAPGRGAVIPDPGPAAG